MFYAQPDGADPATPTRRPPLYRVFDGEEIDRSRDSGVDHRAWKPPAGSAAVVAEVEGAAAARWRRLRRHPGRRGERIVGTHGAPCGSPPTHDSMRRPQPRDPISVDGHNLGELSAT